MKSPIARPVCGVSAGWRPLRDHGLEVMGGYTLISFGGSVSAKDAIAAGTGVALPSEIPDAQIGIHTTIHTIHASLGWRWVLADHLVVRASLGYLQALGSSTRLDAPTGVTMSSTVASQLATASQLVGSTLDQTFKTYVKLPVLGLSLAYRF